MKKRYLRAILSILGVAGVIVFLFFPNEKEYACFEKNMDFYPYGNAEIITNSNTEVLNAFKCVLKNENENCGIGFSFGQNKMDFENWNLMDSIIFELQSSDNFSELVVQALAFDANHTNMEYRNTLKPLMKEIRLQPGKNRYSIYKEHLYTPDYWFEQENIRNNHNAKRFSAITGIEFFSGWKNKTETSIELKIENICTEKHSNVPFVVLVFYLGILITIAISVRIKQ